MLVAPIAPCTTQSRHPKRAEQLLSRFDCTHTRIRRLVLVPGRHGRRLVRSVAAAPLISRWRARGGTDTVQAVEER